MFGLSKGASIGATVGFFAASATCAGFLIKTIRDLNKNKVKEKAKINENHKSIKKKILKWFIAGTILFGIAGISFLVPLVRFYWDEIELDEVTNEVTDEVTDSEVKDLSFSLLLFEEGKNKKGVCVPYIDSEEYPTIGYGQLCAKVKVKTIEEAEKYCSYYVSICIPEKAKEWVREAINNNILCIKGDINIKSAYDKLSNYRKAVLISMAYQLGCYKLSLFKKTLSYMAKEDWENAAKEMKDSIWFGQTEERALRHIHIMRYNNCGNFCRNYGWK